MHPRHTAFRALLLVVAGLWFAAGPSAELLRATFVCHHAGMQMASGQTAPMPNHPGPCVCGQMTGAFDQTLSIALPMLILPTVTVDPTARWAPRPPVLSFHSWIFAPQTRPPIVA